MSAEALRTGESKASPIHTMQIGKDIPRVEFCHSAAEVTLIFRH